MCLYVSGVIIEGPQTVIYFPGQGSIQLVCNATEGPVILWAVNGASFSLIALRDGALPNHTANGTNIVINVPTNNSEYICTATTNLNATSSNPAFVYIAGRRLYPLISNYDHNDQILENGSKSHMKSSVFLHVFNDISIYAFVFLEYFFNMFHNLSIEFHVLL